MTNEFSINLASSINELILLKSEKEQKKFTMYQLAKAIDMPHSILIKLLHADPSKRVFNPRIETLAKIVKFFQEDGFNVTIDDIISGNILAKKAIDISEQVYNINLEKKVINLYAMSEGLSKKKGSITLPVSSNSEKLIALISDKNIEPMFKKGSIFIVDTQQEPSDDTLIAAMDNRNKRIIIRKYYESDNIKILKSYDKNIRDVYLSRNEKIQIIGVVIQVDAKT